MRRRSDAAASYLATLGIVRILGGVLSLSTGSRNQATILGLALIVGDEWWKSRKRQQPASPRIRTSALPRRSEAIA
jgi:hypothetical protein